MTYIPSPYVNNDSVLDSTIDSSKIIGGAITRSNSNVFNNLITMNGVAINSGVSYKYITSTSPTGYTISSSIGCHTIETASGFGGNLTLDTPSSSDYGWVLNIKNTKGSDLTINTSPINILKISRNTISTTNGVTPSSLISGWTAGSPGKVRYQTQGAHGLKTGQMVTIDSIGGGNPSGGYNGSFTITVCDALGNTVSNPAATYFYVSNSTTGTATVTSSSSVRRGAANSIVTTASVYGIVAGQFICGIGLNDGVRITGLTTLETPSTTEITFSVTQNSRLDTLVTGPFIDFQGGGTNVVPRTYTSSSVAISTTSSSGTTYTINTSAAHGLTTGQYVTITGVNNSAYNITGMVTVETTTRFTIVGTTLGPTAGSGGTVNILPTANPIVISHNNSNTLVSNGDHWIRIRS